MVLYRNQWPVNLILHVTKLHIGSSVRYKNTLFGNYYLIYYIVKIILISFNCFSEYILEDNKKHTFCDKIINVNSVCVRLGFS